MKWDPEIAWAPKLDRATQKEKDFIVFILTMRQPKNKKANWQCSVFGGVRGRKMVAVDVGIWSPRLRVLRFGIGLEIDKNFNKKKLKNDT